MPDRLQEIGWTRHECISDSRLMISYYRTTDDGRIVFGKGGWGIALGDRIGPRFDRDEGRARQVAHSLHEIYPMLADVPIATDWCGPIDRTRTGLPIFGHLGGRSHIVYGVGFSGNGVAPAVVGGRILSSLALGIADEWSAESPRRRPAGPLPARPVRFLGAHVVREAVVRKEEAEMEGRKPSRLRRRAREPRTGRDDPEEVGVTGPAVNWGRLKPPYRHSVQRIGGLTRAAGLTPLPWSGPTCSGAKPLGIDHGLHRAACQKRLS